MTIHKSFNVQIHKLWGDNMTSYLIPYVDPRKIEGHQNPMLEKFTYGDVGGRGKILRKKVKKGDYLFFHTSQRREACYHCLLCGRESMATEDAKKDKNIVSRYRNPHLTREKLRDNDTIVFGNPIYSRVLRKPLILNKEILSKLSNPPKLNPNQTELAAISSALRNWKKLTEKDVEYLLKLIRENEEQSILKDTFLSIHEIEQLDEEDIEKFIAKNPYVLGSKLKLYKRQYVLKSGKRIDLLLKDKEGLIVVEVKKDAVGKEAYKQVKGYLKEVKEEFKCKKVKGIIVCGDILPAFEDFYVKEIEKGKINIYLYAWKFVLKPFLLKT